MKYKGQNIDEMTVGELCRAYNEITGSEVKRFSSKAIGLKRVSEALAANTNGNAQPKSKAKAKPKPDDNSDGQAGDESNGESNKTPEEIHDNRAEGQRRAWSDPDVKAKRSQRNGVKVKGETYRSVKQAFEALGLPLAKHIKFRAEVKEKGKAVFKHDNSQYTFTLTE